MPTAYAYIDDHAALDLRADGEVETSMTLHETVDLVKAWPKFLAGEDVEVSLVLRRRATR